MVLCPQLSSSGAFYQLRLKPQTLTVTNRIQKMSLTLAHFLLLSVLSSQHHHSGLFTLVSSVMPDFFLKALVLGAHFADSLFLYHALSLSFDDTSSERILLTPSTPITLQFYMLVLFASE